MSSSALKLVTLLVLAFAVFGLEVNNGLNHLLSENDGDSKSIDFQSVETIENKLESEEKIEKYLNDRGITRPTVSPPIYKPTPGLPTVTINPIELPTIIEGQPQPSEPQKHIELPKPTPTSIPSLPTSKPSIPIYKPTPGFPFLPTVTIDPIELPTIIEGKPQLSKPQLPKPQKPVELPTPTPTSIPSLPTSKPSIPIYKPTPGFPFLPTVTMDPIKPPTIIEEEPQLSKPQKPVELPKPTPKPIVPTSKPSVPTSKPIVPTSKPTSKPAVTVPPTTPIKPAAKVPVCGKKGSCFQWFDDEWQLPAKGYKRCDATNERRAKRYCCAK